MIIHFYEHVEKTRGLKGLFNLMQNMKDRIRAIHQRAEPLGGRRLLIQLWNQGDIRWKGPTKALFELSLRSKSLDYALQLAQLKGIYLAKNVTRSDFYRKQADLSSVVDPFTNIFLEDGSELLNAAGRNMVRRMELLFPKEFDKAIRKEFGRPLKFLPYPHTLMSNYDKRGRTPYIKLTPLEIVKSLDNIAFAVAKENIYEYVQYVFGDILPPIEHFQAIARVDGFKEMYAGTAVGIIDGGGGDKTRWIYSPSFAPKLLLYPIQDRVSAVLGHISGAFHMAQAEGVARVQSWHDQGRNVTTYDLKSASDFVLKSVQVQVILKRIFSDNKFGDALVELFRLISLSKWIFSQDEDLFLRFLCGTPQGEPGSFPGFMAVILLILMLAIVPEEDRAVVGDDFSTPSEYDDRVGYWVDYFHLHISKTKTLWKEDYSEFCSVMSTRQFGILNVRKAKPIDPDNIIPGILRYGPNATHVLSNDYTIIDKNILIDYTSKILFAPMINACRVIDKEIVPPTGGYSLLQLGRMLGLSSVEKYAMNVLVALYFSDVDKKISVSEILRLPIKLYKHLGNGKYKVVTFTLQEQLPCFKPPFPKGFTSFYSLMEVHVHMDYDLLKLILACQVTLQYQIKQQGLLEIKECKPGFNSLGMSALITMFQKNRDRVIFDHSGKGYAYYQWRSDVREQEEDLDAFSTHYDLSFEEALQRTVERSSKITDMLKPTADYLQSEQSKCKTPLPYELQMVEAPQTKKDLLEGERLMNVSLKQEFPWYVAIFTKPYSWASYIFQKLF
jgi:hypothetical protein